jgi:predicted kinase
VYGILKEFGPMDHPTLVLVTGPPASGKTVLARWLAPVLRLPLISKDDLKVILYETLGWGGRERDRKVSDAAYELMYLLLESEMATGRSLMLESNFRVEAGQRIAAVQEQHEFNVIQIRCWASRDVLVSRLEARASSGERHPGHADRETLATELDGLLASGAALALDGPLIEIETTDPQQIDRGALLMTVKGLMS